MPAAQDLEAFLATYVNTNRAPGSPPFDSNFLLDDVLAGLQKVDNTALHKLALPIVAAQCCALKRADLVPAMFLSLHDSQTNSEQLALTDFVALRETITVIWVFVGIPNVVPVFSPRRNLLREICKACLGLSKCFEALGLNPLKAYRLENGFTVNDTSFGEETRREIYKASGNSEVFDMLHRNFGDLTYVLNAVGFGYNIGHVDPATFSLAEVELILTAALIALGATRQVGSHIKACIGFGYSESIVEAIINAAEKLAHWQSGDSRPAGTSINVKEVARQARSNLGIMGAEK